MAACTVLDAVDRLERTCGVGELSVASGLSVEDAEDELNCLMVAAGGEFRVVGEGGSQRVVYSFPPDFRARLGRRRRR